MSDASEPSTPTQDTPTQGHSTKPVDEKKAAELMAIRKFRDDKELPFSNEDLFKYVGVSRTVGYRIFKGKHRRFQTNPDFEETRGRPRALTDDQVNHLVTFLQTEGWEGRSMPWSRLCEAARLEFPKRGKAPASRTIKNFLNQRGWKKCVKCSNFWIDHHKSSRLHCLDCFYEASTKAKAGTSNATSKTTSKPPAKTTAQATSQATSKQPSRVQVDNRGAWADDVPWRRAATSCLPHHPGLPGAYLTTKRTQERHALLMAFALCHCRPAVPNKYRARSCGSACHQSPFEVGETRRDKGPRTTASPRDI